MGRPLQGRPRQEQERQDRLEEEIRRQQEEPMDRRSGSSKEGAQHQGLRRHQEGLSPLQQGQGSLQEVSEYVERQHRETSGCVVMHGPLTVSRLVSRNGDLTCTQEIRLLK